MQELQGLAHGEDGFAEAQRLAASHVQRLKADNPGPLTLSGSNTWVIGSSPAYVIDPGPATEAHVRRIVETVKRLGGLGAVVLTHDHPDHADALVSLLHALPAKVVAAKERIGTVDVDVLLRDGVKVGPLQAVSAPGHARDHFAFVAGRVCFTGDAVLGEGSVFISPDPGALNGYLTALGRLKEMDLEVLCPGHGPAMWDPDAVLSGYIEHRLDRERALLKALANGAEREEDLLDAAWGDVPAAMRPLAAVTLRAHLDKLAEEARLPEGAGSNRKA